MSADKEALEAAGFEAVGNVTDPVFGVCIAVRRKPQESECVRMYTLACDEASRPLHHSARMLPSVELFRAALAREVAEAKRRGAEEAIQNTYTTPTSPPLDFAIGTVTAPPGQPRSAAGQAPSKATTGETPRAEQPGGALPMTGDEVRSTIFRVATSGETPYAMSMALSIRWLADRDAAVAQEREAGEALRRADWEAGEALRHSLWQEIAETLRARGFWDGGSYKDSGRGSDLIIAVGMALDKLDRCTDPAHEAAVRLWGLVRNLAALNGCSCPPGSGCDLAEIRALYADRAAKEAK